MKTDPICGMTVNEATALSAARKGETFYLRSEHCRKKFLAQPLSKESSGGSCCGGNAKAQSGAADGCGGEAHHEHDAHADHEHNAGELSCCREKSDHAAHSHAHHPEHPHHHHHHGEA